MDGVKRGRVGKILFYTGPPNSGKTTKLVTVGKQNHFSRIRDAAFTPKCNSRDGSYLAAMDGELKYKAKRIDQNHPESMLDIVYEMDRKGWVQQIEIGEIQFWNPTVLNVLETWRKEGRIVHTDGLDRDFRGEEFTFVDKLKGIADVVEKMLSPCNVIFRGHACENQAIYPARLLRCRDPAHPDIMDFAIGEDIYRGLFRWAPYFNPTIVVEKRPSKDIKKRKVVYTAACEEHFQIPKKRETMSVYELIAKRGKMNESQIAEGSPNVCRADLSDILRYLDEEGWVKSSNGVYAPQHYVRRTDIPKSYRKV